MSATVSRVKGTSLLDRVRNLMEDGQRRSLAAIQNHTGGALTSVSARLRDLRKEEYGGHTIRKEQKSPSIYVYWMEE